LDSKMHIHPWPSEYLVNFQDEAIYKFASYFYIGLKSKNFQGEMIDLTTIVDKWRTNVYEQWFEDITKNRVYFFNRKRSDLDLFTHDKPVDGFYTFTGKRPLFPH
jgi:hypothetical protein